MELDADAMMNKIKELLFQEMTKISFSTYIQPLSIESIDNSNIIFQCDSHYVKDLVETRYASLILNTIQFITNKEYTFSVHALDLDTTEQKKENEIIAIPKKETEEEIDYSNQSLNPKYTFDTFVVGNNNRFAHAAALAVGDNPAKTYNPLFIYGGVGLGKTHLMQAVGNRILQNNRKMNIVYVTSEKFTNQLINAIKDAKTEAFRNKYRYVDVLLIDDIQFIAGKERIQEEFFHTFNTLHDNGKQIIISSDRPPKDIQPLEDRLRTRFEWGLIADISNPDYETRMAILKKKSQLENIIIDDDILVNIATHITTNIRELEGTLNKIIALSTLSKSPITLELSNKAISDVVSHHNKVLSIEYIQEVVAKYFNVTVEDLKGSRRSADITYPRQIAMYFCRDVANISTPKIGLAFGKRDHSTVMHGCNKIANELKENTNTKLIVETVKNSLFSD